MTTLIAYLLALYLAFWDFGALLELMRKIDRYDSLIQYYVESTHEDFDWLLIKAQMKAESNFDPFAISSAGARGLLQLMPTTATELEVTDVYNPESNIDGGVRYMKQMLSAYGEIPDDKERLKFALGAYNAGRGNINKMLMKAREAEGVPVRFVDWVRAGRPSGNWQTWDYSKGFLEEVTGHNSVETLNYVHKILQYYEFFHAEKNKGESATNAETVLQL